MILYIVRHAIAEEGGNKKDAERELTREGVDKMKKAAAGLRALDAVPDVILTSPLVRARRTAEILMEAFGGKPALEVAASLSPGNERSAVYEDIRQHADAKNVMLVGHQPSLGEIAADLVSGSADAAFELKKGGACAIEIRKFSPQPRGSLRWLATPAMLRKIAGNE